jgi:hypothetical protein
MRWVFDTLGVAEGGYELNTAKPIFLRRMGFWRFGAQADGVYVELRETNADNSGGLLHSVEYWNRQGHIPQAVLKLISWEHP